jgi:drug/metabolite transporter (DMT)-like permease
LLGEQITPLTWIALTIVISMIVVIRRAPIHKKIKTTD